MRRSLRASPRLFLPYAQRRWARFHAEHGHTVGPEPLRSDTEVVIEAFPRSGNTFAVLAFHGAQPEPLRIAHHTHAPASVLAAAERALPTLVIIRHPRDATVSQVIFDPNMTVRIAVLDYVHYYTRIQRARGRIVLAKFESVVTDMGAVIDTLNENLEGTTRNMNEFSRQIRANPGVLLGGKAAPDGANGER